MLGASNKVRRPRWPSWIVIPIGITIREHVKPPEEDHIRIVFATRDSRGLEDEVDLLDLARAHYFTIVDVDREKNPVYVRVVQNTLSNVPRAGLAVAYWLVRIGANIVIASSYCKNTEYYLDQAGIIRLRVEPGRRVRDCLAQLDLATREEGDKA